MRARSRSQATLGLLALALAVSVGGLVAWWPDAVVRESEQRALPSAAQAPVAQDNEPTRESVGTQDRTAAAPAEDLGPLLDEPASPPSWDELAQLRVDGAREGEFLARYRQLAATDPAEFERGAPAVLHGPGPGNEKCALLRVAYAAPRVDGDALFLSVLLAQDPSRAGALSEFCVRFLGQRCARERRARELLRRALWPAEGALPAELRRRAVAHIARSLDAQEVPDFERQLLVEPDGDVLAAGLVALANGSGSEDASELGDG